MARSEQMRSEADHPSFIPVGGSGGIFRSLIGWSNCVICCTALMSCVSGMTSQGMAVTM